MRTWFCIFPTLVEPGARRGKPLPCGRGASWYPAATPDSDASARGLQKMQNSTRSIPVSQRLCVPGFAFFEHWWSLGARRAWPPLAAGVRSGTPRLPRTAMPVPKASEKCRTPPVASMCHREYAYLVLHFFNPGGAWGRAGRGRSLAAGCGPVPRGYPGQRCRRPRPPRNAELHP